MRKIVAAILLCGLALTANAVPARRGWQTRIQADGTTIEVQVVGDEFYHYTINRDGKRVRLNEAGMYEVVGEAPTPAIAKARRAKSVARRQRKDVGTEPYPAPRGLLILANFSDVSFKAANSKAVMDSLINAKNCQVNNGYGSAAQYFKDQSNGQYQPVFDVVGPVTLSKSQSYYGTNVDPYDEDSDDKYATDAVIEACILANNQVNYADYDWNNDGYVDFVYVIYAGKGAADGGGMNTIWPHNWSIQGQIQYAADYPNEVFTNYTKAQTKLDGKYLDNYAMSQEIDGQTNGRAGNGTFCHEFGHVIGLPDFYDTEYGSNYSNQVTPNEWDVMDGGAYNGNGHCPPNYSAWEKYFMGWITPENLGSNGAKLTLYPNGSTQYNVYQINTSGNLEKATKEGLNYYIECRQQSGWDTNLPAAGMLIWKVNFNSQKWIDNEPNNTAGNPLYTLVIPSGTRIGEDYGTKNVWPYNSTKSWSGVTGKPLKEITKVGNNISLIYIEEPVVPVDPFDVYFSAYGQPFDTIECTGKLVLPEEVPEACSDGRVFVGWCSSASYSSETTAPTFAKAGDDVEEGAHFYAVFAEQDGEGSAETTWDLVSNASSLNSGDVLVMACSSKGFTAGDISNQIMVSIESTFSNNQISALGTGTVEFTLGGSAGAWTLSSANGLLGATAVKKLAWGSGTTTWDISISGGDATIQSTTESYGRFLYNVNSPRFTTYTSNTSAAMLLPQLYRKTGGGAAYSNYSTACDHGTGVEKTTVAPKARKMIEEGRVVIVRDGIKYTLLGQPIR